MFSSAVVFTAALGLVHAISITSPTEGAMWQNGQSSQQVSWTSVASDPASFAIQLSNQQGFLTNSLVTLQANQSTGSLGSSQSAMITYPDGTWPTGQGFRINFISSATNQSPAILAQSSQFNITSGAGTGSSASAGSSTTGKSTTPTTLSQSKSATSAGAMSSSNTAANADASGGLPNQNTASPTGAAFSTLAQPSALLLAALGLVSVML